MKILDITQSYDRYKASLIIDYLFPNQDLDPILDGHHELDQQQIEKLNQLIEENKTKPIQYLVNKSHFYNREFFINESVLIPRWDTEILLATILESLDKDQELQALEIGTGSGILAISLSLESSFQVEAIDISEKALEVAKKNNQDLGAKVNFYLSDLFDQVEGSYDLILSNPPYISKAEMMELEDTVLKEPELALYGGLDGLDFYRRIIKEGRGFLKKDGLLIFEIGYNQREAIEELLRSFSYEDIFSVKDFNGLDRVIGARWRK